MMTSTMQYCRPYGMGLKGKAELDRQPQQPPASDIQQGDVCTPPSIDSERDPTVYSTLVEFGIIEDVATVIH